jgi:hypothetical protein
VVAEFTQQLSQAICEIACVLISDPAARLRLSGGQAARAGKRLQNSVGHALGG